MVSTCSADEDVWMYLSTVSWQGVLETVKSLGSLGREYGSGNKLGNESRKALRIIGTS